MAQRSRGFTVIELLVVIGITAVLLAVLIPMGSSMRRSARVTQCASNMRQIGQAIIAYRTERRQWPLVKPPLFDRARRGVDIASLPEDEARIARAPYLRAALSDFLSPASLVYRCPGDSGVVADEQLGQGSSYIEWMALHGYRERAERPWNQLLTDFLGAGWGTGSYPDPQLHPRPTRQNILRTDGSVVTESE